MEASNSMSDNDEDDRRLFASLQDPELANAMISIKHNDAKSKRVSLWDVDPNVRVWTRFGYILGQASCVEDLSLYFCTPNVTEFCAGLQSNNSIKSLHLYGINLGGDASNDLIPFLLNNPSLEILNLSLCNLGPAKMDLLADALLNWKANNLTNLMLRGNRFGDINLDKFVLALSKNKNMHHLNLSGTGIGLRGCTSIAKLLASPECNLRCLRLGMNSIDNNAVEVLAESLALNTHLKCLCLNGNNAISTAGWMAMLKLMCNSASIDDVMNSNQKLISVGIYSMRDVESVDNALGKDDANLLHVSLKLNKYRKNMAARRKILLSHARGDLNIGESSIPDSLIPRILTWISNDSRDVTAKLIQYHNPPLMKEKIGAIRLDSIYRFVKSRSYMCGTAKGKSTHKNRMLLSPNLQGCISLAEQDDEKKESDSALGLSNENEEGHEEWPSVEELRAGVEKEEDEQPQTVENSGDLSVTEMATLADSSASTASNADSSAHSLSTVVYEVQSMDSIWQFDLDAWSAISCDRKKPCQPHLNLVMHQIKGGYVSLHQMLGVLLALVVAKFLFEKN